MRGLFCALSTLRETLKRNSQRRCKPHPSLFDDLDLDQHLYNLASLKLSFEEKLDFIKTYQIDSLDEILSHPLRATLIQIFLIDKAITSTVGGPLFCNFKTRKSYKIRGTLQNGSITRFFLVFQF